MQRISAWKGLFSPRRREWLVLLLLGALGSAPLAQAKIPGKNAAKDSQGIAIQGRNVYVLPTGNIVFHGTINVFKEFDKYAHASVKRQKKQIQKDLIRQGIPVFREISAGLKAVSAAMRHAAFKRAQSGRVEPQRQPTITQTLFQPAQRAAVALCATVCGRTGNRSLHPRRVRCVPGYVRRRIVYRERDLRR